MVDLVHLPEEVLDVIIDHVYEPLDLMSLGSSCRRLRDLVHLDHLQWRSISILFEDLPYLVALLDSQRRYSLVQRLRIESYLEPGDPVNTGYRAVRRVTRKEPNLEELVTSLATLSTSLGNIRTVELNVDALDFGLFDGFFAALRATSPFFTRLSISATLVVAEAHEKWLETAQTVISGISGLTHFSWYSDDYFNNPISAAVESQAMKHCPDLEHLDLHFGFDPRILDDYPPAASSTLWSGNWPSLKWLQLNRVGTNEHTGTFLARHPNIETLNLYHDSYPWQEVAFELPPGSLPNLRQVWWPFKQNTDTLLELLRPLPDGLPRPIEILTQITLTTYDNMDPTVHTHQSDGFLSDEEFEELCVLVSQIPTLRVLGIENARVSGIPKLAQLGSAAQGVEEVLLWLRTWPGNESMAALADALSNMPRLTSLHLLGPEPYIEHQWLEAAAIFARLIPGLSHFSGFDRTEKRAGGWEGEEWKRPQRNRCAICREEWPFPLGVRQTKGADGGPSLMEEAGDID